jgi:hypothetical protein
LPVIRIPANNDQVTDNLKPATDNFATILPMADLDLTILMPCLNEAETLASCVRQAVAAIEASGVTGEVVVADNGSTARRRLPARKARGWWMSPHAAMGRR